jgi:DNA-binding response OmpR family regulator
MQFELETSGLDKTRLLIVDDDAHLSRFVKLMLEKTKAYEVRVENLSSHALAEAREFQPDLVLLDVDMPGLDGGDVARLLRADPALKQTPIIFFTSLISQDEAGRKMVSRGGEDYLAKPVEPMVLLESIESVLGRAKLGA